MRSASITPIRRDEWYPGVTTARQSCWSSENEPDAWNLTPSPMQVFCECDVFWKSGRECAERAISWCDLKGITGSQFQRRIHLSPAH